MPQALKHKQKLEIVKQTNETGRSDSLVTRQHRSTEVRFFLWRKAYLDSSLVAVSVNETNVPASELKEATIQIKQHEGDLPPSDRTKVMEQSPLISENSGYETIQIYR